ncbi:hypothetical protein E4S40_14865 [Algoriphagus kandeliae]|uniref:Uncharacterized protein n=1 Tax=Algoriphagus kandeliae TaxID=2562278 RepID=A0A4Y9QRK3_9BACT|nr:hypothetical protein [Algoriphagus kandeliae]TFV93525.1 hypothetical protein E4S40_14865 [Algoriphagus kandeliae]
MNNSDLLITAYTLAQKQFELPELSPQFDEEQAVKIIAKAVGELLDRDLEKLLQICYRIDLSEQRLKEILHESAPDQVAEDLAKALWERQKQKAEIWKRYS